MPTSVTAAHRGLETALQSRLGAGGVAVVCTGVDGDPEDLWPEERPAVANAIARRQREYAAGRHAARTAMQRLGRPAHAIPTHPDRSPCWPKDLVGSISHTSSLCLAVVGTGERWKSIGVDVESDSAVDETTWDSICTPEERRQLQARAPSQRASFATRVFVAKEAFYKWHYPQHRILLDFQDVSVQWHPDSHFRVRVRVHAATGEDGLASCIGHVFAHDGVVVAYVASGHEEVLSSKAQDGWPCNLENSV